MDIYKNSKLVKSKKNLEIIIKYLKKYTVKVIEKVFLSKFTKLHYQDLILL